MCFWLSALEKRQHFFVVLGSFVTSVIKSPRNNQMEDLLSSQSQGFQSTEVERTWWIRTVRVMAARRHSRVAAGRTQARHTPQDICVETHSLQPGLSIHKPTISQICSNFESIDGLNYFLNQKPSHLITEETPSRTQGCSILMSQAALTPIE